MAEGPPPLPQAPAPLEQVATCIRARRPAAGDMRQRAFAYLIGKARALGCPIAKTRPKTVRHNARTDARQCALQRILSKRPPAGAGENKAVGTPIARQTFKQCERRLRQRHAKLLAGLHARRSNRPHAGVEVYFAPTRAHNLAGSSGRQDREFERTLGDTVALL